MKKYFIISDYVYNKIDDFVMKTKNTYGELSRIQYSFESYEWIKMFKRIIEELEDEALYISKGKTNLIKDWESIYSKYNNKWENGDEDKKKYYGEILIKKYSILITFVHKNRIFYSEDNSAYNDAQIKKEIVWKNYIFFLNSILNEVNDFKLTLNLTELQKDCELEKNMLKLEKELGRVGYTLKLKRFKGIKNSKLCDEGVLDYLGEIYVVEKGRFLTKFFRYIKKNLF